jgi:hypothetical protein
MNRKTRFVFVAALLVLLLAIGAFAEQRSGEGDEVAIQLIKLRVIDEQGEPVAHLILPDGDMGSIYFENSGKAAIGLIPKSNASGKVEISVYRVERVSDEEEVAEFQEKLPPLARGARGRVSVVDVADLTVEFIDMKTVMAAADVK